MSGDGTPEGGQESGAEFRQKFESVQAEAKQLRELAAKQLGVQAQDLVGVPVDQFEQRAAEVKQKNVEARQAAVRDELADRGWTAEQIEQFFAGEGEESATHTTTPSVAEQMGSLAGAPPSAAKVDTSTMTPDQKIAYGISQRKKQLRA